LGCGWCRLGRRGGRRGLVWGLGLRGAWFVGVDCGEWMDGIDRVDVDLLMFFETIGSSFVSSLQ
jgi:hypothetical protein